MAEEREQQKDQQGEEQAPLYIQRPDGSICEVPLDRLDEFAMSDEDIEQLGRRLQEQATMRGSAPTGWAGAPSVQPTALARIMPMPGQPGAVGHFSPGFGYYPPFGMLPAPTAFARETPTRTFPTAFARETPTQAFPTAFARETPMATVPTAFARIMPMGVPSFAGGFARGFGYYPPVGMPAPAPTAFARETPNAAYPPMTAFAQPGGYVQALPGMFIQLMPGGGPAPGGPGVYSSWYRA
jgi:hypothetical protein